MTPPDLVPLRDYHEYPEAEMLLRSRDLLTELARRRTVRDFSDRAVPRELIENCIRSAGTAVSGANMQQWQFVAVQDAEVKHEIRTAAEAEERAFYAEKAPQEWLDALAPLRTDANKPFLDTAPWLIAILQQRFGVLPGGRKVKHYYATKSFGIATGLLITAIHNAGLASLTHSPSPMKFLNRILGRARNERPFLLLVVGYPARDAQVPDIAKKPLDEIATFI